MPAHLKPTRLKVLAGNPGKRKLPEEREVDHDPPTKPAWLTLDAGAIWDEMAPAREGIGLLTHLTQEAFAQLCVYLHTFRTNRSALTGAELVDMRAKMTAFGMDPSGLAKAGIATGKPKNGNAFAKLG